MTIENLSPSRATAAQSCTKDETWTNCCSDMATMTMIELADGNIFWECSECGALLKDKKDFELKTAHCPKCGADVVVFVGLYEDE